LEPDPDIRLISVHRLEDRVNLVNLSSIRGGGVLGADISQLYAVRVPYRHGIALVWISRLKAGLYRINQGVNHGLRASVALALPRFWKAMPPMRGRELLYATYYQSLIELG
jgi:hypothetical protein